MVAVLICSRLSAARARRTRAGQAMLIFAITIVAMFGMIGLGVDVGHAYERRQFVQGAAHNAARAGAFEIYANTTATSPLSGAQLDAVVVRRMIDTLSQSSLSVRNLDLSTPSRPALKPPLPSWSACQASPPLRTTEVYLQAYYVDDANQQVHNGDGPYPVGPVSTGSTYATGAPSWAEGVQVTRLAMCVPHFFSAVSGHGNYDVNAGAVVGLTETTGSFDEAKAPFYMWGARRIVNVGGTNVYTATLYGEDAPQLTGTPPVSCANSGLGSSCTRTPGDLVTIHNHDNGNGNWDQYQYYSSPYGLNYTPSGMGLHDGSNRGCLDPNAAGQDLSNISIDNWYFNHGGTGHCASPVPNVGDTVAVPVVDEVCKQNNCGDGTGIPPGISQPCQQNNGGYCVRIVAIVLVYITNNSDLVQGYITGVVDDPYCIVEVSSAKHHPACNAPPA